MDKYEIDAAKNRMIEGLKMEIESTIIENFVEKHEMWRDKLGYINNLIRHIDPIAELYTYDEFCKKIIEITKESLNGSINYEKLFLTSSEYYKILEESKTEELATVAIEKELAIKLVENLMVILNGEQIKGAVKYKLKEQFHLVESELDKSFEIANSILKNHNNG